jgi:plasmid replication initiation protein
MNVICLESIRPAIKRKNDRDLFIADAVGNIPIKDEVTSMEYPLFSLTKKRDTCIHTYSRNGKTLRIIPSTIGTATIFDKDILIYALSQIVQATESGRPVSRRILIKSRAFLENTKRSVGGASYERIIEMCRRLKGTIIETNTKTNEEERTEGFSMIEAYSVQRKAILQKWEGALEVELTLSEWLYRNLLSFSILTLHPDYFTLAPLERRLYELARKHCGD